MQSGRAGGSVTAATRRRLAKRRGKLMDKAILLAIAASVCTATASLCQRKGARSTQTAGFDARLLVRLARQPAWLLGIAAMISGFAFQITALRYGDLALVQPILAAELLFVFGYLAIAGTRRATGRDLLAAAAMSAGIGVFLRLAAPSGGRLHAPGSSWLLAGLITGGVVAAALAVASGLGRRAGAYQGRRTAVLGAATGITWGFMAAVIKELSSHLGDGPSAVFSTWSLYVLVAAGAVTMLLAAHALAAGPLAASQPGFTILDPLAASLLGVFLFGEHIRTDAGALAGEALALAVVIAGAAALSRSSLIAVENAPPVRQHQPALSSAASASPATRPSADPADPPVPGSCRTRRPAALSPDVAVRAGRTRPGPSPAAARTGPSSSARKDQDHDPERAAA
jgi:drug/metabolite transporter (DMT)-like permease